MKRMTLLAVVLFALIANTCQAEPPYVQIQNKQLRMKLYLPDAKEGFYRGTRFDWSGVVADLEFAGHHIYRPWFVSTDPGVKDFTYKDGAKGGAIIVGPNSAMTGPAEEFQTPIGYDSAKPGDVFLKVGVGLLRRGDDAPYAFSKHFDLVNGGKWTIHKTANSITFEQTLGDRNSDYGYVYSKTIRLVGDSSAFAIEHRLRNTGKLPIVTKLYDHNFLTVDGLGIGPAYTVSVPYTIVPTRQPDPKFARIEGSTAQYIAELEGQDRVAFGLQGFSADAKDYEFRIVNRDAKLQLTLTGDRPLINASLWSIRSVMAVEPFINIQADPGKDMTWSYRYAFATLNQ